MLVPTRSIAAAVLSLALGAGCATFGQTRSIRTADRLGELSTAVEDLRERVTATASSLSALVAAKDQDPSSAFAQFQGSVDALDGAQRRVDLRLEGMREYAQAYFLEWKEQAATISDEDLKERSEERRAELAAAVEDVVEEMKPVREEITVYLAQLRDTLKYLSIDLTPQGISAIDGRAKSAGKSSKSLGDKLGDVLEAVHRAAPQFAQARASTPARKPGVQHQQDHSNTSSN